MPAPFTSGKAGCTPPLQGPAWFSVTRLFQAASYSFSLNHGAVSGYTSTQYFAGTALTDHEMSNLHCEKITSLQRAAFKHLRDDLLDFCMGNVANVDKRESLRKLFGVIRCFHLSRLPLLKV